MRGLAPQSLTVALDLSCRASTFPSVRLMVFPTFGVIFQHPLGAFHVLAVSPYFHVKGGNRGQLECCGL